MHDAAVLEKDIDIAKVLAPLTREQIGALKKEEVGALLHMGQNLRLQLQSFYNEAVAANVELQQKRLLLQEQYVLLKNQLFAKRSEKTDLAPKLPHMTPVEYFRNVPKKECSECGQVIEEHVWGMSARCFFVVGRESDFLYRGSSGYRVLHTRGVHSRLFGYGGIRVIPCACGTFQSVRGVRQGHAQK